jgi:hypothetical protein
MKLRLSPWNIALALAACVSLQMNSFVFITPLFTRRFSDFGTDVEVLGAFILDNGPPDRKGQFAGMKSTAGSLGNVLGPALVVLISPFVQPQAIFLMAVVTVAVIIFMTISLVRLPINISKKGDYGHE